MSQKKELGYAGSDPRFMTPKQLSSTLQVSLRSIRRRIQEGMPYSRFGGAVRFDLDEVKSWLKTRRR